MSDPQQWWDELSRGALVGTDRASLRLEDAGAPGTLLTAVDIAKPAGLLTAAAVVSQYLKNGRSAQKASLKPPPPASADERLVLSPSAASMFSLLVGGSQIQLVAEFLEMAHHAGFRIPPLQLPTLLSLGAANPLLRESIRPLLDCRGEWLAAQNPEWSWGVPGQEHQVWQTGSRADRRDTLAGLRRRDPDTARALLESTFSTESAEDRAAFVELVKINLDGADEPFLEQVLKDRSREVRRVAMDLLARLPDSQFCAEAARRTLPLLQLNTNNLNTNDHGGQPGFARSCQITVSFPDAAGDVRQRDRLEASPPSGYALSPRLWSFSQQIAEVPISTWTGAWNMTAEEILHAAQGEHFQMLLQSWAQAAVRQRDRDWAEAILRFDLDTVLGLDGPSLLPDLLTTIGAERLETVVLLALRDRPGNLYSGHVGLVLLDLHRRPWSYSFSREVIERLRLQSRSTSLGVRDEALLCEMAPRFGFWIPPDPSYHGITDWLGEELPACWRKAVGALYDLLQRRLEIHSLFQSPKPPPQDRT